MKRKLTFVLGLLIASLTGSVFAQSFDEQKTYSICNRNDANIFMQDNGTGKVALGSFNDNSYWKLIATTKDNCYYVQNAVTQKYMQSTAGDKVEVNTGDTPVEISIILCTDEGEGMYGMASTDQATYDFTSGTIGANWRDDGVVQGFAAVSGTNHRSFWKIVEAAMPEQKKLTSPFAGNQVTEGSFYLYNVESGLWFQNNNKTNGTNNYWTTRGELGTSGLDIELAILNDGYQLKPRFSAKNSVRASDYYLDTNSDPSVWVFTPKTVEGITNAYTISSDATTMASTNEGYLTNSSVGATWQLVTKEQRLDYIKENASTVNPIDVSFLVGSYDLANNNQRYAWTINRNGGSDGWKNENFACWVRNYYAQGITSIDISQKNINVPNGIYKAQFYATYAPKGLGDLNSDDFTAFKNDGESTVFVECYANDQTVKARSVFSEPGDAEVQNLNQREIDGKWFPSGPNQVHGGFSKGRYLTDSITVTVTNGKLDLGVRTIEGCPNTTWVGFAGVRLYYVGKPDLTEIVKGLNEAISKAEAFNGNTTTTLQNAVNTALTEARAALESENGELMSEKAIALANAVLAAKAIDVTLLQQTIAVCEEGVDLTEANDFLANGTSTDALNDLIYKLRTARKINALGVADTFTGSTPTADTEYYLYNIGTGMWLANGSDWNTHAAVDIYPLGVKLIAADGGKFKMQTHMFKNREEKWINYNAYVDTNGQDTWTFNAVEGKENVYTINSEGDRTDVGRLLGYDPFGPTDKGSYRYWSNVAKDREGVNNPNNQWKLVTRAELDAKLADASKENPVDVSYLIDNGGLNRVWSLDKWNHAGGAHMSSGDDGNFDRNSDYAYEYYNTDAFSFTQELNGLTPGKYEVRVNGFFRQGNGDYQANIVNNNGELISETYLKANNEKVFLPNIATEAGKLPGVASKETNENGAFVNWGNEAINAFETGLYKTSVEVIVGEDGKLTIGVGQDQKTTNDSWTMFDSFRLFYLGNEIDLGEYLTALNNAITDAEAFDGSTTSTVLADSLATALTDAKDKQTSTDKDEIISATTALNTVLAAAKAVNIVALKATADLAKTEVDADALASVTKFLNDATTAAETAIAEATTAGAIEQALFDLTAARKINALSTTATYKGSVPAAGKVYLFNVGTGMFMGTGSDWNTHAAVDQVGIEFELVDLDTPEVNNFKFKTGRGGGWMAYNGYVDTDGQDIWHFLPVAGKEGVYNISSTGNDGYLLGYNPNKEVGKKYWNTIGIDQTGLDNPMNQWIVVTPAERAAMIEDASEENPVDVSYLIKNASLNRQDGYDMYTKACEGGNGGARVSTTADGDGNRAADYAYEFFEPTSFSFSQNLTGLKAGKYVVMVQGFFRNGNGDAQREAFNNDSEPVRLAYLFANNEEEQLANITEELDIVPALTDVIKSDKGAFPNMPNAAIEYFQHGAYWNAVEVEVGTDGQLTIGVKKNEKQLDGDWTVIDNFRLIYMGNPALETAKSDLATLIQTAKGLNTTGKTEESVSALNTAISDAETALAAEDATVESLTTAKTNLQTAINNLADIVDGINVIEAATKAGKAFNMQGQQVKKAQKGVYIINGKKNIVK